MKATKTDRKTVLSLLRNELGTYNTHKIRRIGTIASPTTITLIASERNPIAGFRPDIIDAWRWRPFAATLDGDHGMQKVGLLELVLARVRPYIGFIKFYLAHRRLPYCFSRSLRVTEIHYAVWSGIREVPEGVCKIYSHVGD